MTATRSVARPQPARKRPPRNAKAYSAELSPEVRWYLGRKGIKLKPEQAPLWRTPEPTAADATFSPSRVDKVLDALGRMRHTQGKWAGHPLTPDAWQVAYIIAPLFGWIHAASGLRVFRSAWVEVPRKNGKTTIAAGLGLYLAFGDGEAGAQVIAAAGSKDQARNAFRPAYLIAQNTPAFQAAGIAALKTQVLRERDQSFFMPVAAVGDLLQGTNPNGYIADEMHVHKSLDVIDALESGTGARDQPLGIIITTADDGGQLTPYAQRRAHVEKLCRGSIKSPTEYAVVWGAPDGADPFSIVTWRLANPGFGVSPTEAFMRAEAAKAKASPVTKARFLRLNLNVRTKQETRYIELAAWDRNAGQAGPLALKGRTCYGGLDLASVSDLTALCLLFPHDDDEGFAALWRYWTPEANLPKLDDRTNGNASVWASDGWLTLTPGDVTDYAFVRAQLQADAEAFDIESVGFDPYNASQLTTELAQDGLNMVKVRQGFLTLSSPTKQLQRLILAGKRSKPLLEHGGNPVTRWCVDNLAVEQDAAGNVKPSKAKAGDKIDGFAALVNSMSEALAAGATKRSEHADHGLILA